MSTEVAENPGLEPGRGEDHLVHEVVGPALTPVQTGVGLGMGVIALVVSGSMPLLLGALAADGRLPVSRIGDTAMVESLAMAATNALFSSMVKPARMRLIGLVRIIALAMINLSMIFASGYGVMALRALAGVPEGILLWFTIGIIVRSATPERWAGVYYTGLTLAELGLAGAFTAVVVPNYHANGAFILAAALILMCAPLPFLGLDRYAVLPDGSSRAGAPPPRGWIALSATFLFTAGLTAVAIYFVPLAKQANLSAQVAGLAITASLAVQILGSAMATALAGRISYFIVLMFTGVVVFASWACFMGMPPAWLFIAAAMAIGFVALFSSPFQVPMLIEADPTRRAAAQSGGVGLLGGAAGPFLASRAAGDNDVHGVVILGAVLLAAAMAIYIYLRVRTRARAAALALAVS